MSSRWSYSVRALYHRNFRLYFIGHAISTLGTWVQMVALSWLIYRLTDSAAFLGITTLCQFVASAVCRPDRGGMD